MKNLHGAPCSSLDSVTACVVYTADSLRKFDSKSNRTANSIRDSIRTQKNDSQLPTVHAPEIATLSVPLCVYLFPLHLHNWLLNLNFCTWIGHDHSSQEIEGRNARGILKRLTQCRTPPSLSCLLPVSACRFWHCHDSELPFVMQGLQSLHIDSHTPSFRSIL